MSDVLAGATEEAIVNRTAVLLKIGDITSLPVDALVYYAREDLQLGSGHGTAIQMRGGEEVKRQLRSEGSMGMGDAVITTAGGMAARYIIHACGPKFQEPDTEWKLKACIASALKCADEKGLKSIAFPPMGAGFYGVPLELCSDVMTETIWNFLQRKTSLMEVIICVTDSREFLAFREKLRDA